MAQFAAAEAAQLLEMALLGDEPARWPSSWAAGSSVVLDLSAMAGTDRVKLGIVL